MKRLFVIAGEASGDARAAEVVAALQAAQPDLQVCGAGGEQLRAAGMEILLDLPQHAVVGIVDVLKNLRKFTGFMRLLVRAATDRRPDAVLLVDYPGFNLRFARQMKRRGIKVIYYVSPQLWAWHASRLKQIRRDVALMLTIFPFEKEWYAARAPELRVEFVGHPLAERAEPAPAMRAARTVLLLPGSRDREVAKNFPVMAAVADRLPADVQLVACAVDQKLAAMMRHPRVRVEIGTARDWMRRATLALLASGTATMECAFAGCPMVVIYRVNWFNYCVARLVAQVRWLAMPNIIAGRGIVPEFIQHQATPAKVFGAVDQLLNDAAARKAMQRELADVVRSLGGPGAAQRAADLIARELAG